MVMDRKEGMVYEGDEVPQAGQTMPQNSFSSLQTSKKASDAASLRGSKGGLGYGLVV